MNSGNAGIRRAVQPELMIHCMEVGPMIGSQLQTFDEVGGGFWGALLSCIEPFAYCNLSRLAAYTDVTYLVL